MFCEECGTKNEAGVAFCENCGHKMEATTTVAAPKTKKVKKPMSKKNIMLISIISAVVVLIGGFFIVGSSMTNPKNVALKYFRAMAKADLNAIYPYLYTEKSEFVSKDLFISKNEEDAKKNDVVLAKSKVNSMSTIDNKKGEASITIDYTVKKDDKISDLSSTKISLKKSGKKLLIFDDWKVVTDDFVSKDIKVSIPKGSKVKFDGIEVGEKYLNKEKTTDSTDVYAIPSMITGNYKVLVTLPFGFDNEEEVAISYDGDSYTLSSYSNLKLPDEKKKTLEKDLKKDLETLYNSAIEGKKWNSIKESFEYTDGNISSLQSDYNSLESYISRLTKKLTSITFSNVNIDKTYLKSNGKLSVEATATYTYKLSYKDGEEEKTYESKDSEDNITFTMEYKNDKFELNDIYGLNTYYSAY